MATKNLGFGDYQPDPNLFLQAPDTNSNLISQTATAKPDPFDLSGDGWQRIMMGLSMLDASRPRVGGPPPLAQTIAPFLQMMAQQKKQKQVMQFLGSAVNGAPPEPGLQEAGTDMAPAASAGPAGVAPPAAQPGGGLGGLGGLSAGGAVGGGAPGGKIDFTTARQLAQQAGFQGPAADTIAAISQAESSGNPYAWGDKNLGNSYGITQINEAAHGPVAKEAYGNPLRAMQLAYNVSKGGSDFTPWTMYKNGGYQKYLPASGGSGGTDQVMPILTQGQGGAAPTLAASTSMQPNPFQGSDPAQTTGSAPTATDATPTPRQAVMQAQAQGDFSNMAPRQMAQAQSVLPNTAPPQRPDMVQGARSQAAVAAKSVQYWTKVMIGAGMLGDEGKGLLEAAKAHIDIAKGFLTPTDVQKNVAAAFPGNPAAQRQAMQNALPDISPGHAGAVKSAETGAETAARLQAAGLDPNSPQGQEAARNMLPDTRPEAARLADAAGLYGSARSTALAGAIGGNAPTGAEKESQIFLNGTPEQQAALEKAKELGRPQTNISQKVEGQGQAAMVNAGIEQMKTAFEGELAANKRTQLYGQMAQAMQGFTPGATAELRTRAQGILKDIGVIQGDNVPPAEIFRQAARHIQIAAQPKGQGQVSNYERELFAEAVPGMTQTPEAIAKAIDIARRLDDYDRQVAQIHRDVARENGGLPNMVDAQDRIAKLGPPLSQNEMTALNNIREAAKGGASVSGTAPGAGQPAQAAPAAPTSSVNTIDALPEGKFGKTPDGNWYKKENGRLKYLGKQP